MAVPLGDPEGNVGGGLGDKRELNAMGRVCKGEIWFYFAYFSVIYAFTIRKYMFSLLERFICFWKSLRALAFVLWVRGELIADVTGA